MSRIHYLCRLKIIIMNIKSLSKAFIGGAFDKGVLQMIAIFILAGAFAGIAKGIGSVDATVAATLRLIPGNMLYAGLFFTSCLISFSVGTSMGTIAAVVPLACGIAEGTGISLPFIVGNVVGGAFFGDNLSFISDTTLAATKALKVNMRDKFRANIRIVLPAVAVTLAYYIISGYTESVHVPATASPDIVKLIPYLLIIALSFLGIGVIYILSIGILSCIAVGYITGGGNAASMAADAWAGICGMSTVIIVAIAAGGVLALIKQTSWFNSIVDNMPRYIKSQRGAMGAIAGLVSITNIFTANNTVAILTVGGLSNDIADRYCLDHRKTAGILDLFSCLTQSLLPYGAQLLMASAFAGITAVSIIPHLLYPLLMGVCALVSILRIK